MAGTVASIPIATRLEGFDYAIRNIVTEARRVEAAGRRVHYLNIGDPVVFGFATPPHLVEAVEHAMRMGYNGYTPAAGIDSAREAVAQEYTRSGVAMSPDRVILTSGTSEGIELALSVLVNRGDEVLIPLPTYPFYTRGADQARRARGLLPDGSRAGLGAGSRRAPGSPVPPDASPCRHQPKQPHGCGLLGVHPTIAPRPRRPGKPRTSLRRGLQRPCLRRTGASDRSAQPGSSGHLVLLGVEGLHGAGLAHRLDGRGGRRASGPRPGRDQGTGGRTTVHERADAVRSRSRPGRRSEPPGRVPGAAA